MRNARLSGHHNLEAAPASAVFFPNMLSSPKVVFHNFCSIVRPPGLHFGGLGSFLAPFWLLGGPREFVPLFVHPFYDIGNFFGYRKGTQTQIFADFPATVRLLLVSSDFRHTCFGIRDQRSPQMLPQMVEQS